MWKRRRVSCGVTALTLFAVCPLLCLFIGYVVTTTNYSDFTQFPNEQDARLYLENNLKVGKTTYAEVQAFIDKTNLRQCVSYGHLKAKENDAFLCTVRRAGDLVSQTFLWVWYDLDFIIQDGILIEIKVRSRGVAI